MSQNNQPDAGLVVATVDAEGTPPVNRISNAQGLWGAFQESVMYAGRQDVRFASIRGCYDGFPPVNPAELDAQGLRDAPNINTKQMAAKLNTYVSTWIDHNTGGDQWFDVTCKPQHAANAQEWNSWNQDLTQFFNEAIKEWGDTGTQNASQFIFQSCVRDTQMGLFGIGIAYFTDPIDWRWKAIPTRKVYAPEGTELILGNCEALFVEDRMSVTQLYRLVKDPDKKDNPWNRKAVLTALYNRTAQNQFGATGQLETFASWENRVRNNDSWLNNNFSQVQIVHGYVQEFDTYREKDGISHYVILRDGLNEDYLYERSREYQVWDDVLVTFADNAGPEGDWHGVKGFGDMIFDGCHFNNLMFNQIALGAIMTTLPMFQASSDSDRQKLNQIVFSRLGILFPDVQIAQLKLDVDLGGGMAVLGESNRILNTNTRIFPQNDTDAQRKTPTATQVSFDRQDQAQFTSGQIKLYRITGADRLGFAMYKRLAKPASKYPESWPGGKAAAEFRRKCKARGIPEKCYSDPQSVRATRSGGSGNMALDTMKAKEAMAVATPGQGQMSARREVIASLYGRERVSEFIQEEPVMTPENVIVGLENAVLEDGKIIPAYPFQPPELHLGVASIEGGGHLGVAMAAQQAATLLSEDKELLKANVEDAQKLNRVIEACFSHIAQHGQFMATVPLYEKEVQALSKFLRELQRFHQAFGEDVATAMQEAQPQGQQDPEMVKTLLKAQADAQALMIKTQAEIQANWAKTQAKIAGQAVTAESRQRVNEINAIANAERKNREQAMDLGIQAEQALADLQTNRVLTLQQLNLNAAKENQNGSKE